MTLPKSPKISSMTSSNSHFPIKLHLIYPSNWGHSSDSSTSNQEVCPLTLYKEVLTMDQLALKAKAGDKKATEEIIKRLQPLIISSIKKYYSNWSEYDDLVQDGNIKILESIKDYDPSKGVHFLGYAKTILMYLYLDKHKRKIHTSLNQPLGEGDTEVIDLLVSEEKDILDIMVEEENNTQLNQALSKLTERQRQIILLFYTENLGIQEIANKLNISYRTVVNTKTTALSNMKKTIQSTQGPCQSHQMTL